MTIPTANIRMDYAGNGSTVTFPYTYKAFANTDLRVLLTEDATGVSVTQTLTTHYTVSGVGSESGGNVVMVTAPPVGYTLTILATIANTQTTDLVNETRFYQSRIEDRMDKLCRADQVQAEKQSRSMVLPESEAGDPTLTTLPPLAERKGKTQAYDAITGAPVMFSTASTAVSSVMEPVLQANTLALARSAMGVSATPACVTDAVYGADQTGIADSTAAITAALAANAVIDFGSGTYRITSGLTIGAGKRILANKAVILKDFDGIGLTFNGGSDYAYVDGDLEVRGYGAYAATGLLASTSANAHGILLSESRVRVTGALRGNNHQGDGIRFAITTGNANKCDLCNLWASGNASDGVRFTGTKDDASVWNIGVYTQTNYKRGVSFDTDFSGRNWSGFVYAEGNAADATSNQVDIGKLRSSTLFVYAEMGAGAGVELAIGANCTDLDVFDARANLTTVHATAAPTCRTYTGGRQRAWGTVTSHGTLKLSDVNNNAAKWSDYSYVTSEGEVAFDRVRGDRTLLRYVYDPGTLAGSVCGQNVSGTQKVVYGAEAGHSTTRFNGTKDVPTTLAVADVLQRDSIIAGLASSATKLVASCRAVITYVTATKAAIDYIWATTPNGASAAVDTFKIGEDGNIGCLQAGKGIRLIQPNGTVRLLTVSDAGALVIT